MTVYAVDFAFNTLIWTMGFVVQTFNSIPAQILISIKSVIQFHRNSYHLKAFTTTDFKYTIHHIHNFHDKINEMKFGHGFLLLLKKTIRFQSAEPTYNCIEKIKVSSK